MVKGTKENAFTEEILVGRNFKMVKINCKRCSSDEEYKWRN